MQFAKFRGLVHKYPWLIDLIDINGIISQPQMSRYDITRLGRLREFVRHTVEFIAFRPFQALQGELEIKRGYRQNANCLEHALCCDPYFQGDLEAWFEQEWLILTHNGARLISSWCVKEETSILDTVKEIEEMNKKGFMGDGDLGFDYVAKRVTEGKCQSGPSKLSLQIYPFPLGYRSTPAIPEKSVVRSPHELEAYRAYINGGPMPPIIPSI